MQVKQKETNLQLTQTKNSLSVFETASKRELAVKNSNEKLQSQFFLRDSFFYKVHNDDHKTWIFESKNPFPENQWFCSFLFDRNFNIQFTQSR